MTNEELLKDLKQFIDSKISQATATLVTKEDLNSEVSGVEIRLSQRLNDVQDAIADTLIHAAEPSDKRLDDHEYRLTTLEKVLA